MGAFEGLTNYFKEPLTDIAKSLNYSDDNIAILKGDETALKNQFPDTYNALKSCLHNADGRSFMKYGQDLVASWIFEDYFFKSMKEQGLNISLSGADKNRKILSTKKVSSNSDYVITTSKGRISLELVNDYKNFWSREEKLHLRDFKYLQLQRKGSLMLAIQVSSSSMNYTLFDFRNNIPAKLIAKHPPFYGKTAYELNIPKTSLKPFTFQAVKNALQSAIDS